MSLPQFAYFSPGTLEELYDQIKLVRGKASLLAGGTDLIISLKQKHLEPENIINLKRIEKLKGIELRENNLHLGALTTLRELQKSPLANDKVPILTHAAGQVASPLIRNRGTIGGNLCLNTRCWNYNQSPSWRQAKGDCYKSGGPSCFVTKKTDLCTATYAGDLAPVLIALSAQIRIYNLQDKQETTIPVKELFASDGKQPINIKRNVQLLKEIIIPAQAFSQWGVYQKVRYRGAIDFPVIGLAATLSFRERTCTQASLVLTGVGSAPLELAEVNDRLIGSKLEEKLINEVAELVSKNLKTFKTSPVSVSYKRTMVRIILIETLNKALQQKNSFGGSGQ